MMERLRKLYGKTVTATLVTQYRYYERSLVHTCSSHRNDLVVTNRMHQDIMSWPSEFLYDNLLEAESSVASHLLRSVGFGHLASL